MKKQRRLALFLAVALFLSSASYAAQEPEGEAPDAPVTPENELYSVGELVLMGEPFEVTPEMVLERQSARTVHRPEWPEEKTYEYGEEFQFRIGDVELVQLPGGFDVLDSGGPVTDSGPTSRAALADLRVIRLATTMVRPLPVGIEVPFTVQVENIGTATAYNPTVAIYFDNKLQATVTVTNSLLPNQGVTFAIDGISSAAGNHTLRVQVNPSSTIPESNYGNNAVSVTYSWTTWPNLSAYEVLLEGSSTRPEGMHTFSTMEMASFVFTAANLGPASAVNVPIIVYFDDGSTRKKVAEAVIPSLAANTAVQYQLDGMMYNYCDLEVDFQVDPNGQCRDYYLGNNTLLEFYIVEPDLEWNGRWWPNPEDLTVQMDRRAYSYLSTQGMASPVIFVDNALRDWNGISSASFAHMVYYEDDRNTNAKVMVTAGNLTEPYALAVTAHQPLSGPATKSIITLNLSAFMQAQPTSGSLEQFRKYVLTHEAGHVLGLAHPTPIDKGGCRDSSIMRYDYQAGGSMSITYHDEHNVVARYDY